MQARVQDFNLRHRELEQRERESIRGYEYAKAALHIQVEDRKDERKKELVNSRYGFWIVTLTILSVITLIMYALHLGKEAFVLDIVKVLVGAAGGGGVGYLAGYRKGQKESVVEDDQTQN